MIKELSYSEKKTEDFTAKATVFRKYLPSARIEIINIDKIPLTAIDYFEFKSRSLIDARDYKPGNFSTFFLIHHDSGEITYAAQQTKTYFDGTTEILTYLVDTDQLGNKQGEGELRNNTSGNNPYFKNKPFAGWTKTEDAYKEKGLGSRRLLIMNALSQMLYDLPLHSDTALMEPSKRILERLLREGKVDKYKEGELELDRYVFKE